MNFNFQPILEGERVQLRPLEMSDKNNLFSLASDPLVWEQHPAKERSTPEGFEPYFAEAIACGKAFAITEKISGRLMGTSRYNLVPERRDAIEIGWTFLARVYWGGDYNREIKSLMINHAFTYFRYVLFYVHAKNFRSQKAMEKIGGKRITVIEDTPVMPRENSEYIFCIPRETNTFHQ